MILTVEEDYPAEASLAAMVEDLIGLVSPELQRRVLEYLKSFNSQCLYCTLRPEVVDVRGEPMRVWGFHTGGWSGAEEFLGSLHEVSLVTMMLLQRRDGGGHYYYQLEVEQRGSG